LFSKWSNMIQLLNHIQLLASESIKDSLFQILINNIIIN